MLPCIIVIDDATEIIDLFQNLLTEEGYIVFSFFYGVQDGDAIARLAPDLIILDVVPTNEAPAWQLLHTLSTRPSTATIPILICTTDPTLLERLPQQATTRPISALAKPFEIEALLWVVRHILASSSPSGEASSEVSS